MGKRTKIDITRNYLESIALPNHGGRYTPISHKSIIDKVHEELVIRGFVVEQETYRSNLSGSVANGIYILDQGSDPDMKMMFVWGNSYDKSMRFKCGIGVYVPSTENYIFAGNVSNYARKHTGKADEEAIAIIQTQLNMANVHYAELLEARNMLENSTASLRTYSEVLGRLFVEKDCIKTEQAGAIKDAITKYSEDSQPDAWEYYNIIATTLRLSHPKSWFEDQSECHKFITSYFSLTNLTQMEIVQDTVHEDVQESVQEPTNQLDIFEMIADMTRPTSPTDVIEDDLSLLMEVPEEVQEQMAIDNSLEQKTAEGIADPDQDFFNFGESDLPVFDLPDL